MSATAWDIWLEDLAGEPARGLVRLHLEGMHAHSPPGNVFALDFSGLIAPDVTVWSAWQAGKIAGIAALKDLGGRAGELKSMRTHPDFLRRGVAAALLEHIIGVAMARGMTRLSLETGSGAPFEPALSLYRRRGFVDGAEFGGYRRSAYNQFLHLNL
jgi:putative acetyltransferase